MKKYLKIFLIFFIFILVFNKKLFANGWGLVYEKDGEIPRGEETIEFLKKYDSYYVGDSNKIYFTFDAGYENGYTEHILDILKKYNVPGAFFLTGIYIKNNPDIIKRMVSENHIVANHTMTHPNMTNLGFDMFKKELDLVNEEYKKIMNTDIPKYYRPPEGKYTEKNLEMAKNLGYKTIFWSLAYVDWKEEAQPNKEEAFKRLVPRIHKGAVILLHNTSKTNSLILEELILKYISLGYEFGSLDHLTGIEILENKDENTNTIEPVNENKEDELIENKEIDGVKNNNEKIKKLNDKSKHNKYEENSRK
ncbi:MAG: polysaccharide deacetylase family protein [Defluviitaleaceae bacterium]|nr:polysaccharide deacetylase family protein [Defluviitaleaceae bacterium]